MTLELLDALSEVDDEGTIAFLLSTLTSLLEHDDVDWENEVTPLVESLVPDPSAALQVLQQSSDGNPLRVVERAQQFLASRQKEENEGKTSTPSGNEAPATTIPRLLREPPQYTEIPGAHNRAISLRQLQDVYDYVQAHVVDETNGTLPWTDPSGTKLTLTSMNLYHLVEHVLQPLTESFQCSMVEMLATGPQKAQWVSSVRLFHPSNSSRRPSLVCVQRSTNQHAI